MNGYEKILNIMRDQGSEYNPPGLEIVEMDTANTFKKGTNTIEPDDYYIASDLYGKLSKGDKVLVLKINDGQYVIIQKVREGE